MASPAQSPLPQTEEHHDGDPRSQNSNSVEESLHQEQPQQHSQPQSPKTLTLETLDLPQPDMSTMTLDRSDPEGGALDCQAQRDPEGMHLSPSRAPMRSTEIGVCSLVSGNRSVQALRRGGSKRKKAMTPKKRQVIAETVRILTESLRPIWFRPSKNLDFLKHEKLLKRLYLWDFVHLEFDRDVRPDLLIELIGNFTPARHCSYVKSTRINLNRADMARALKLPVRKEKLYVPEAGEGDVGVLPGESLSFIEDLLSNWVLLHEDMWMMPSEVVAWTKLVKEGHPEKVDWASLIWFMVEKELLRGPKLVHCYYASHLQWLIRSQKKSVFDGEPMGTVLLKEEGDGGRVEVDIKDEDEEGVGGKVEVDIKDEEEDRIGGKEEVNVKDKEENWVGGKVEADLKGKEEGIGVKGEEEGVGVKVDTDLMGEEEWIGVKVGDDAEGEEEGIGVKVGDDAEGEEEGIGGKVDADSKGKDEGIGAKVGAVVKVEEEAVGGVVETNVKEEEEEVFGGVEAESDMKEEEGDGGNVSMADLDNFQNDEVDEQNLQLTLGQDNVEKEEGRDNDIMDFEKSKEEEPGQWYLNGNEQYLRRCNLGEVKGSDSDIGRKEEEEEVEEDGGVGEGEGGLEGTFTIVTNCNVADGLSSENIIPAVEGEHIPYSSTGQLQVHSSRELLASATDAHRVSAGPSIFSNANKRAIDEENDISLHSLHGNHKRLKIDGPWEPWDNKPTDFFSCLQHAQQWMERARMMYEAKEQACEESNMNQQILLNELQQREGMIEHLHKTKYDEMQKKQMEIYKQDRELRFMYNLLEGYKKALQERNRAFDEYRQRCPEPDEPLYMDVPGSGGLVLSTTEIEKQRLKQEEEDMGKRIMIENNIREFEAVWTQKLKAHLAVVDTLGSKVARCVENATVLKELRAKKKVTDPSACALEEA